MRGRALSLLGTIGLAVALSGTPARGAEVWQGPASLLVHVEDAAGQAVAGARVRLLYQAVEPKAGPGILATNAEGEVSYFSLSEGWWAIEVAKEGALTFHAEIVLSGDKKPAVLSTYQENAPGAAATLKIRIGRPRTGIAAVPSPPTSASPQGRPAPAAAPAAAAAPVAAPTASAQPTAPAQPAAAPAPVAAAAKPDPPTAAAQPEPAPAPTEPVAAARPTAAPMSPPPVVAPTPAAGAPPSSPPTPTAVASPSLLSTPATTAPAAPAAPAVPTVPTVPAEAVAAKPISPTSSTPEPTPGGPPPAVSSPAPTPAAPATPALAAASRRSYADRTCLECKPGEEALTVERAVEAGGGGCGDDLSSRLASRDLAAAESGLGGSCGLLRIVLPAGTRFTGYRYEVEDGGASRDCRAGVDCPVGACSFPFDPGLVRIPEGLAITAGFENRSPDRARRAILTVYFSRDRR